MNAPYGYKIGSGVMHKRLNVNATIVEFRTNRGTATPAEIAQLVPDLYVCVKDTKGDLLGWHFKDLADFPRTTNDTPPAPVALPSGDGDEWTQLPGGAATRHRGKGSILEALKAGTEADKRMDDALIATMKARLSKITPGQWESEINRDGWLQVISRTMEGKLTNVCGLGDTEDTEAEDHANADFIGNAPDDIRYLLAERDRLTASNAALQAQNATLRTKTGMPLTGDVSQWQLCTACHIYVTDNLIDGVPICVKCESIGRRPAPDGGETAAHLCAVEGCGKVATHVSDVMYSDGVQAHYCDEHTLYERPIETVAVAPHSELGRDDDAQRRDAMRESYKQADAEDQGETSTVEVPCPVCDEPGTYLMDRAGQRQYRECTVCGHTWFPDEVTQPEPPVAPRKLSKLTAVKLGPREREALEILAKPHMYAVYHGEIYNSKDGHGYGQGFHKQLETLLGKGLLVDVIPAPDASHVLRITSAGRAALAAPDGSEAK